MAIPRRAKRELAAASAFLEAQGRTAGGVREPPAHEHCGSYRQRRIPGACPAVRHARVWQPPADRGCDPGAAGRDVDGLTAGGCELWLAAALEAEGDDPGGSDLSGSGDWELHGGVSAGGRAVPAADAGGAGSFQLVCGDVYTPGHGVPGLVDRYQFVSVF